VTTLDAQAGGRVIRLPASRGPWTETLYGLLTGTRTTEVPELVESPSADALWDHDLQMALYLCYELHYSGLEGVDDRMEWSSLVLMLRGALEREFEAAIRKLVAAAPQREPEIGEELQRLVREDHGPPLSRYIETQASHAELLEHVVHRSAYQLKEADPHSWAIPRLTGRAKAALLEIQADEYGGGRHERMHSVLFENTMRGLGLDPRYGAYVDWLPGVTLATVNLMSWFGLHRRLRGAVVGHLAIFEMTSAVPNRRYANGIRRLGYGPEITDFYDEHVEADAVHENIAAWDLGNSLAVAEPDLADDILFGARALLALEARWAEHLLSSWRANRTSLLHPLALADER
jgi:hypothetical protein